jgi:chromate reductase, NAD(P)H dehydrogenase (quinone)
VCDSRVTGEIETVRVLALCGSLRKASSNRALIDAAMHLSPKGVTVTIYPDLALIPLFNPDLDTDTPPPAVAAFRHALQSCDALLLSSPEYAHGVSGVMKNALDWVVGSGELIGKPIALMNTATRATHAHAALRETLLTMSARVIDAASITVALEGARLEAADIANDARLSAPLASALSALAAATRTQLRH